MEEPLYKVQLRGGYSDRNGIDTLNTEMQVESFDERTRIAIRNEVGAIIHSFFKDDIYTMTEGSKFWRALLSQVYSQPVNYNQNYFTAQSFCVVESTIMKDTYAAILSLLEFIITYCATGNEYTKQKLIDRFNSLFEREYVGYRYIGIGFTRITDDMEADVVKKVLQTPYTKVKEHMKKALYHLSNRDRPDYENSIKESITAVEEMCQSIVGRKCTLGEALDNLGRTGLTIHPALKAAFDKLYGYTCDASGVRHAGQLGGPDSTFDEAKYMLVTCSAFVNYLISVQS